MLVEDLIPANSTTDIFTHPLGKGVEDKHNLSLVTIMMYYQSVSIIG